mgnify:FL=1|jgi:predicted DNA binding protein|tara:strand:- start:2611 stop:3240 length:630 start_codon:yes stop_codon:yes gene_type:complete
MHDNYVDDFHFSPQEDYTLTRSEFAKKLGITRNALKQRMRRGKHMGDYVLRNGDYLFRNPVQPSEGERVIKGQYPGNQVPIKQVLIHKAVRKRVNRGNHHKAKYPNQAFKEHNERKMLAKINETDPDFLNQYTELKKLHREKKQQELRQTQRKQITPFKNYGGFIRNPGHTNIETEWKPLVAPVKDEYDRYLEDELGVDPKKPKVPEYY